jgi:hypothetical protein
MEGAQPTPFWYHIHGSTSLGDKFEVRPKAWVHAGGETWWQLDPFFKALELLSPKVLMSDWLNHRMESFVEAWGAAGISKVEALLPSLKSQVATAKMRGQPVDKLVGHHSFCMSTVGLLVWLRRLSISLHRSASRAFASAVLVAWLLFMLPSTSLDLAQAHISAGVAQRCQTGAVEDGLCCHIQACRRAAMVEGSPQLKCAELWCALGLHTHCCHACKAWDEMLVRELATLVDAEVPAVAMTTDPKVGALITKRGPHERVDEDYKKAVVDVAVSSKRAKTCGQAIQADGVAVRQNANDWSDARTLLEQAACWDSFKECQCISVIGDASRVGNPAENCEVIAAWSPGVGAGVWLPPQAISYYTEGLTPIHCTPIPQYTYTPLPMYPPIPIYVLFRQESNGDSERSPR